jgi:small subunit ribosomal protein S17
MPKRILQGKVVSNAADKTAVILVERKISHPLYKKIIRRSKKYHAHDPENRCQVGQLVRVIECAPISKLKCWQVIYEQNAA